uniref:Uncharacterized protein n=1 Tax=Myotis myotis TaxID=51298 RepID=A0A7J7VZ57_MYOMY|nr:hypothetical protein mMyoMyo1_012333 [Myotis myotis]
MTRNTCPSCSQHFRLQKTNPRGRSALDNCQLTTECKREPGKNGRTARLSRELSTKLRFVVLSHQFLKCVLVQQKLMYTKSKGSIFLSKLFSLMAFGSFKPTQMGTYNVPSTGKGFMVLCLCSKWQSSSWCLIA